MKKIIFIILLSAITVANSMQSVVKQNKPEVIILKHIPKLSIETQISMLKEFILYFLGDSFKYYHELKSGSYIMIHDKSEGNNNISIMDVRNNTLIDIVKLKTTIKDDENMILEVAFDDVNRLIIRGVPVNIRSNSVETIQIIEKDSILWDQVIVHDEELSQKYWTKILNKSYTMSHLENQNNDEAILFKHCIAGKIIPYDGGTNSKLLMLDNEFHSILFFDASFTVDDGSALNGVYGIGGNGNGEFNSPTGFTLGRPIDGLTYPVYVSDFYNGRIAKVNYVIDPRANGLGNFNNGSFESWKNIIWPTDVTYFKSADSTKDKIWMSQKSVGHSAILSIDLDGNTLDRFIGYKDENGTEYYFSAGVELKLAVYNHGFAALGFIDKERNSLVTCLIDADGNANIVPGEEGEIITAGQITQFPSTEQINSVTFHRTAATHSLWPYVWVTSPSYIHLLKMDKDCDLQYLASTSRPKNSDQNFTDLLNTIMVDDYYDVLTVESWNSSYGLRKYWTFCDIYNDSLYSYCNDSLDLMKFKATFTNDCWLRLTAKRKNINGTWDNVKIKKVNGTTFNDTVATKWQLAGWNQASSDLFIDIQLDLPITDYALGGQVKLTVQMYPEYYPPPYFINEEHVNKQYIADVKKTCLEKPGGCPFIYVKNNNDDYEADNNILHRMEFSEPNVNITDKYKLRTEPKIENGSMELYLVENENDFAFIDQFKLYAVDYPVDKKMGITEDNKIVIYDSVSVIAGDSVMLNAANITSNVNYFNPGIFLTNGYKTDGLYAHFSYPDGDKKLKRTKNKKQNSTVPERSKSKESFMSVPDVNLPVGFIANLRNLRYPIAGTKDTAGYLTATSIYSNTVSKIFARRELESVVILPLFNDTDLVDHLNIQWQSDFRMKYIGMTTLDYTNYVVNEPMLKDGFLVDSVQQSTITSSLTEIDGNYGEFNSSSFIKMSFDLSGLPSLAEDYKREYIIEVTGNYINGGNMQDSKKSIQELPLVYRLSQNYPNPFNPITKINYELPKNSMVKIVIYDILGREVTELVNNELKQAGRYTVEFDARSYASGVYFYRIEAGSFVQAKKMVLLK